VGGEETKGGGAAEGEPGVETMLKPRERGRGVLRSHNPSAGKRGKGACKLGGGRWGTRGMWGKQFTKEC